MGMNFLFIEKNAHMHVYMNFFKLLLFYLKFFFFTGSNVAPLFALFFFSFFGQSRCPLPFFFFSATLAEKPNSRKRPNNMGGKKLVNWEENH